MMHQHDVLRVKLSKSSQSKKVTCPMFHLYDVQEKEL